MTTLVTGASGNLGRQVVKELHAAGIGIRATDKAYTSTLPTPVVVADLCDKAACYDLLKGCTDVVHLGNIPNIPKGVCPQDVYTKNCCANANIFQSAMDLGIKNIIFASSIQTFVGRNRAWEKAQNKKPNIQYLPLDGWAKENPTSLYGLSKVAGEQMLRYFADIYTECFFVSLRFPYLMAENLSAKTRSPQNQKTQWAGIIDELFSYLRIEDAAKLICAIIRKPKTGYYQLFPAAKANLQQKSARQLIDEYYTSVPLKKPVEQIDNLVDNSEIEKLFGWQPQSD